MTPIYIWKKKCKQVINFNSESILDFAVYLNKLVSFVEPFVQNPLRGCIVAERVRDKRACIVCDSLVRSCVTNIRRKIMRCDITGHPARSKLTMVNPLHQNHGSMVFCLWVRHYVIVKLTIKIQRVLVHHISPFKNNTLQLMREDSD